LAELRVLLAQHRQSLLGVVELGALVQQRRGRKHEEEQGGDQRDARDRQPQDGGATPVDVAHAPLPRASASPPGNAAASPRFSSMRSSWLNFATRSERAGAPVLI